MISEISLDFYGIIRKFGGFSINLVISEICSIFLWICMEFWWLLEISQISQDFSGILSKSQEFCRFLRNSQDFCGFLRISRDFWGIPRKSQDFLRLHGRCSALPIAPETFIIPPMEAMSSKPVSAPRCRLAAGSLQGAEKPLRTTCTPRAYHVHTTCTPRAHWRRSWRMCVCVCVCVVRVCVRVCSGSSSISSGTGSSSISSSTGTSSSTRTSTIKFLSFWHWQ